MKLNSIENTKKILKEIINTNNIRTVFQPIVNLTDASIIGYEALSRGPESSILEKPEALFKAAKDNNMIWELESICWNKAIERSLKKLKSRQLFINIDTEIVYNEIIRKGFIDDFLTKYNLNLENIIFELTVTTSIEDIKKISYFLSEITNNLYKNSIGDSLVNYSQIDSSSEIMPKYLKLDMYFIREINNNTTRHAFVKSLCDFASSANIEIIAEGIENQYELSTLIDLGVKYGQGFFLQKPSEELLELPPNIKKIIEQRQNQKQKPMYYTLNSIPIGELARMDTPISSNVIGKVVNEIFKGDVSIQGITVVDNGVPVGLINRSSFFAHLATQYGVAVFMNRPIRLLMNKNPMVVDYNTNLSQVSKIAISRKEENLYDLIIITKDNKYYGVTTVKTLLEYTTQLELNKAKHSNPLTGLPGNIIIEEKLNEAIEHDDDAYIMYFDLDNFKAYNDVYGFENGDKILILTAEVIQQSIINNNIKDNFVGHIGGDDFVVIVSTNKIEALLEDIINMFDERVTKYYSEYDAQNGYIISKNRKGEEEKFNLVSISIAVTNTSKHKFISNSDLGEFLGAVKKKCKLKWNSCYIIE